MIFRELLLLAVVVCCSAQYRPGPPSCPDVQSRYQEISSKCEEFSSVVEVKINRYDDIFEKYPYSQGVICSLRFALEELKGLFLDCRRSDPADKLYLLDKWIGKIDGLIRFSHGLCGFVSTRGPEVGRVSESIVSFKQELYSLKSSFKAYDISSCDGDYLQRLESKLVELKQKWEQHQSFLSSVSVRGRYYDETKSGGHLNAFNTNSMAVVDSFLKGNTFEQGNIKDSSTNKFESSSYNYAPSYGRAYYDTTKIGGHGNVGNTNAMSISNSYLSNNTLSQGNIEDRSTNTYESSSYKYEPTYGGGRPYSPYGRAYDHKKVGGHGNIDNTNAMGVSGSYLANNTLNQGNIDDRSITYKHANVYNFAPTYGGYEPYYPSPYGRAYDGIKVGLHGNVGNTNTMGVSGSYLENNTLSQGNIDDKSTNYQSSSTYKYAPTYGGGYLPYPQPYYPTPYGRAYDNIKVGLHGNIGNTNSMSVSGSHLENNTLSQGNIDDKSTNYHSSSSYNYEPSYGGGYLPYPQPYYPTPYGRAYDNIKVGLHGNVGNTNSMSVSGSYLENNTLSQGNIDDKSTNYHSSSSYNYAPTYGGGNLPYPNPYYPTPYGRAYDSIHVGGHGNVGNTNAMSIDSSYLANNTLSQGNIEDKSTNYQSSSSYNYAPTYGGWGPYYGPSYGRAYDSTSIGLHGNVGNKNDMSISNSYLANNAFSQGNIEDKSTNMNTTSSYSYTPSYPYRPYSPYGRAFDGFDIKKHGNVGNKNDLSISGSHLFNNTLSQGNVFDSSVNTHKNSTFNFSPRTHW